MDSNNRYNLLGYPNNRLLYTDAFTAVTGGLTDFIDNYSRAKIERLDARIRAQEMMRQVRENAAAAASNAAAVLSVASIDVSRGTARKIIDQSLIEAEREVSRIRRTTP